MRARYAAFALLLADYLIETTHSQGPAFEIDRKAWKASILRFSKATDFCGLEIIASDVSEERGEVTFRAKLMQGTKDASFTEHSHFLHQAGRWTYLSGTILDR